MSKQTIKELRMAAGLTQTQLAESIGVASNTVYRWERGMVTPDTVHLIAMAETLGIPIDAIEIAKKKRRDPGDTGTR